jgi:xylan 1,4-beta-xylosidase
MILLQDPLGPETKMLVRDGLSAVRAKVGPDTDLYITEIDDAYNDDTSYSAAFIFFQAFANNGIVDLMSWWPFSDIFEEGGLYPVPFDAAGLAVDGLVNVYGIPKPSFHAFQLLGWSGDTLVDVQPNFFSDPTVGVYAVTGNSSHTASIFLTNWQVKKLPCPDQVVTVTVKGLNGKARATSGTLYTITSTNGNAYDEWVAMGSPFYLKPNDVEYLTQASRVTPTSANLTVVDEDTVAFTVSLPGNTVANVILH